MAPHLDLSLYFSGRFGSSHRFPLEGTSTERGEESFGKTGDMVEVQNGYKNINMSSDG